MGLQRDLDFLSGRFLKFEIPKDKKYLKNYFRNESQIAFLRYYLVFGDWSNFVDHTGRYVRKDLLVRWEERFHSVCRFYEKSKRSLTEDGMNKVNLMEIGKLSLAKIGSV